MVLTAALLLALAQTGFSPAVLVVERPAGGESTYVNFSSFARCETERRHLERAWAEANRRFERTTGARLVAGTGTTARCIPG
jgi:hypothetical protein